MLQANSGMSDDHAIGQGSWSPVLFARDDSVFALLCLGLEAPAVPMPRLSRFGQKPALQNMYSYKHPLSSIRHIPADA